MVPSRKPTHHSHRHGIQQHIQEHVKVAEWQGQSQESSTSEHTRYSSSHGNHHPSSPIDIPSNQGAMTTRDSNPYGCLPPEPTPPDSGRSSKHLSQEYQLAVLAESASSDEDCGHQVDAETESACLDRWHPEEDEDVDQVDSRAHRYLSREVSSTAGPSSSRQRKNHSISPGSYASSSSPSSPPRTFGNPSHAGIVFDQLPIRDTPNNPFLEEHKRRYTRADAKYEEKKHGRGEEAARAHRRGFLTYVFRGQRILHPDIASDDDSDEESDLDPRQFGPGTRLQPKLLFPEAHAQERRRARMRGAGSLHGNSTKDDPSVRSAPLGTQFADDGRESFGNTNRQLSEATTADSCGSLPYHSRASGNLFATEISRREEAQIQRQEEKKRKRLPVEAEEADEEELEREESLRRNRRRIEFLNGKEQTQPVAPEAVAVGGHAHRLTTSRLPQVKHLDQNLLAQLERAGWSSSSASEGEEEDEENMFRGRRQVHRGQLRRPLCPGERNGEPSYREEPPGVDEGAEGDEEGDYSGSEDYHPHHAAETSAALPARGRPGTLRSMSDNPFDLTIC